jgi:hypothetical protein
LHNAFVGYNIILLAVLYGCESWSLVLKEERGWAMFVNRVLREVFGHKRGSNR